MDDLINQLKRIIAEYSGVHVDEIDYVEDPHNQTIIAVRAFLGDGYEFFILDRTNLSSDSIEQVEFNSWPPTSDPENMYNLGNMGMTIL